MRRAMLVGAVLLLAVSSIRADLAPRPGVRPGPAPQPGQSPKTKVSIEYDEKATEPRLIIPMQIMFGGGGLGALGVPGGGQIGGAIGTPPPPGGIGGFAGGGALGTPPPGGVKPPPGGTAPPGKNEEGGAPGRQSSLPLSTLIIGMALALSLSTGGLWAVRRKTSQPGGGLTPLLLLVAFTAIAVVGTATVWANRPPPPRPPQQPQAQPQAPIPGPLPALLKMEGVTVTMVPQGDTVRLILPKKHKEALQKGPSKPVPKEDE